jgi:hypothetical protein
MFSRVFLDWPGPPAGQLRDQGGIVIQKKRHNFFRTVTVRIRRSNFELLSDVLSRSLVSRTSTPTTIFLGLLWLSPCRSVRAVMRLCFPRSKSIEKGRPFTPQKVKFRGSQNISEIIRISKQIYSPEIATKMQCF